MTDPLTAANASRDILTAAIGPALGYHVSQCSDGGYIVLVDGKVRAARSTLHEAIAVMGDIAADKFGESPEPPERAADVTQNPVGQAAARMAKRFARPPQTQSTPSDAPAHSSGGNLAGTAERVRTMAALVLAVLMMATRGVVGV